MEESQGPFMRVPKEERAIYRRLTQSNIDTYLLLYNSHYFGKAGYEDVHRRCSSRWEHALNETMAHYNAKSGAKKPPK